MPTREPEPDVDINCLFFDPDYPAKQLFVVTVSEKEFQQKIHSKGTVRSRFIDSIPGYEVREKNLMFYQPIESLSITSIRPNWTDTISDTSWENTFAYLSGALSLQKELGDKVNDSGIIHLVLRAIEGRPVRKKRPVEEIDESRDTLAPLRENTGFKQSLTCQIKSPSEGSKCAEYATTQAKPETIIYDGLCSPDPRAPSTISSPVHIYNPAFQQFTREVNNETTSIPTDFTIKVLRFMIDASTIHSNTDENEWKAETRAQLSTLLGHNIHIEPNTDSTSANGVSVIKKDGIRIPYSLMEAKLAIGEGGCDPTIQCGNSMRAAVRDKMRLALVKKCNCPMFLIAISGPWLSVLGGVHTDIFIVQRLTSMLWIAPSNTHDNPRVFHVARVLYALKNSLDALKEFYFNLPTDSIPEIQESSQIPHPRNFPYPNTYANDEGNAIVFKYITALENDPRCVTYLAKEVQSNEQVVIKFVSRYSKDAHRLLADRGYAPCLRYFGNLPASTVYDALSRDDAHGTQADDNTRKFGAAADYANEHNSSVAVASNMQMVVMDFIEGSEKRPENARDQLVAILKLLHAEGFVFGDLRAPNIMFTSEGLVKLIDFDWAGCYDKELIESNPGDPTAGRHSPRTDIVCYPIGKSMHIQWPEGAEPLAPIIPSDDLAMLDKL